MGINKQFKPNPDLKLMDQVREVMRFNHYKYRTELTYCDWVVQYIKFHGYQKHPREMGKLGIETFLSHLATERKVSASTQRQTLNAIVFLLDLPIANDIGHVRAKQQSRPPIVLTKSEVQVFIRMSSDHLLMAKLLYRLWTSAYRMYSPASPGL